MFGGIEVEGYLRKASAEELKDYQRYYLAFEECEKYYYVTYKKSRKPDKELYFDERSVLSITWAGKPFEKIIDGEKRWDIEIVRAWNATTAEKGKRELNAGENAQNLLLGN